MALFLYTINYTTINQTLTRTPVEQNDIQKDLISSGWQSIFHK